MPKKTPGKLHQPPDQGAFDKLPLPRFCAIVKGVVFRLHSVDPKTGNLWHPVHFSVRGRTRFDPADGVGTLCVAQTLAGALMEIFDDSWGAVGTPDRSLTALQLQEWHVTRFSLPEVVLFDATGPNLSKIGTDAQLISGAYDETRSWALRIMNHPANVDGILYSSRHDIERENVALFQRAHFLPAVNDPSLNPAGNHWTRPKSGNKLIYGSDVILANHPDLDATLTELEVAILP